MKLSDFMIKEDAGAGATSASSIAAVPGGTRRRSKMLRRAMPKVGNVEKIKYSNTVTIKEAKDDSNVSAIVARLNAAKHRGQTERPYVTFGLEDQRGNLVRVKVAADQSQEFEQALAQTLEDDENDPRDIGEVIYDFKDRFDILGIDWPRSSLEEADEETADEPDEAPEDQEPSEDELEDPEDDKLPAIEEPAPLEPAGASSNELNSTLIAIVDMLKSEIEAKKAEARAREKEAEAQQAKYAAEISANKVRAEQDILDMEAWNKKNSAEQKEARKLAMLAKYRYEKGQAEKEDRELDSYQMVGRFNKS